MAPDGIQPAVEPSVVRRLFGYFVPPNIGAGISATRRKRPTNLVYDVDSTPPMVVELGVAIQHIFLMSVGWIYVVLIMNSVGADSVRTLNVIRMSMIASGIATILQARGGLLGSGYLC